MTSEKGFSHEAQRYLDGESGAAGAAGAPSDARERAIADHLNEAVVAYREHMQVPGPAVDQAVMAAVRARRSPVSRRSIWRWFMQPQLVPVRPALAAAAVIAFIALWSLLLTTLGPRKASSGERAAVMPAEGSETVLVRFELRAPDAEQVAVAGSFNDWSPDASPLTKNPATGLWTGTIALRLGEHQYLFVVDDTRWIPDPTAHAQVDDGFGQSNSVIVVGPRGVVRS